VSGYDRARAVSSPLAATPAPRAAPEAPESARAQQEKVPLAFSLSPRPTPPPKMAGVIGTNFSRGWGGGAVIRSTLFLQHALLLRTKRGLVYWDVLLYPLERGGDSVGRALTLRIAHCMSSGATDPPDAPNDALRIFLEAEGTPPEVQPSRLFLCIMAFCKLPPNKRAPVRILGPCIRTPGGCSFESYLVFCAHCCVHFL